MTSRYEALLVLTGHDETADVEAFCSRYEVERTPTFLVLDAEGTVVLRRSGPDASTIEDVLGILREAEQAYVTYRQKEAWLRVDDSLDGRRRLAKYWADHYQHASARSLLQVLAQDSARKQELELLAAVLRREGDAVRYGAVLRRLLADYPADPERISWRIGLALADIPDGPGGGTELLQRHQEVVRRLKALLELVTDPLDRACVQGELAMDYEEVMWFPEAPRDSEARMYAHHAEILKLRRLDPARPHLLLYVGHALDWSREHTAGQVELARAWLQAMARVDTSDLSPSLRAELEMYTPLVQRRLTEAEGGR